MLDASRCQRLHLQNTFGVCFPARLESVHSNMDRSMLRRYSERSIGFERFRGIQLGRRSTGIEPQVQRCV